MKEAFDQQAGIDWYNQLIIDGNTADERLAAAVEAKDAEIARWTDYAATLESERSEAKAEIARLREALEKARGIARGFWLDYPVANIADAGDLCGICEGISDAIAALSGSPDGED